MTDLYVSTHGSDSNAGSKGSPLRTIEKASTEASAGTTVHVAPGTYEGGFKTTADGVHYVSDVKWGAKIVPAHNSSSDMAWDNRGDNVRIDGFEVDGGHLQGGTLWRFGLYTAGTNSVVENNRVHDLAHDPSKADNSAGGGGIYGDGYYGDTNIAVRDNVVYNIGPDGAASSLIHGIYHSTTGSVTGNLVYDNAGVGIHLWHDAHNVEIANNTVTRSNMGVWVGGGDTYNYSGSADHVTVSNNNIHDNRSFGITEGGNTGTHNSYVGNRVADNGTDWHLQNGLKPVNSAAAAADAPTAEHLAYVQQAGADAHAPLADVSHALATPVADVGVDLAGPALVEDANHHDGLLAYHAG